MLTEPMTLYKLMNLYMLKQVNFPLTNAQLTNFFTEHEYTTYFTLQQALNELEDAGLSTRRPATTAPGMTSPGKGRKPSTSSARTYPLPSLRTWTSTSRRTSSASGRRWEQRPTSTRGLIRTTLSTVKSAKIRRPLSGWIYPSLTGSRQKPCAIPGKQKARKSMPTSCGHFYPDLLCRCVPWRVLRRDVCVPLCSIHRKAFPLKRDLFQ